ncbi:ATP-dependent helicase [Rhodococcus sp. 06-156-3C]|nr:ATP-dependent helicase [Rhodococcus sp. 06-156-3C]OZD21684.1 ATP-dependent helicase [Rhodococcus sp. 06-156-4C]OZD25370.1 ATP-dependent helicase [Rhodococcus sp. 06-156-4a]OZD33015.1 ATP-dependent helicase [Rhodococcus sp. 06-156-3b]OZD41909.1 ATP-dependent helicase [Rhodococcus sp. 06-156-3]OZF60277.1 ATP-dependent helicase [Rhodococcus sp. 06-156-4]
MCVRVNTRKARPLSKIVIDQESDTGDTTLSAQLDDTHVPPTFAELGVREDIVKSLTAIGIERTFAIQELTLPLALAGDDLIGQARTGMGKTYGFGVPLLHRIATTDSGTAALDGTPRALVIVPTRELCVQVTSDLTNASKFLKSGGKSVEILSIYGGRPYEAQIAQLQKGVDVVVGTPGRLLDLAKQGHLILGKIGVLVLDEADEMLDLGFLPDIERILGMVPSGPSAGGSARGRQTMLFSATMPGPIITLARTFLTQPTHIRAEEAESSAVHDRTAQHIYRAHALDKVEMVSKVLQAEGRGATMIFTRTKRTAQKVSEELLERGFAVGAVHGDLGQIQREKALKKFRTGGIDVLVATDVAARGIDIDDVTHVINYQCPEDEKTYVHRIGRTGRAGRTGIAVTLVDWDDIPRWQLIDKALNLGIPDPVETYSSSPHLFEELGIPDGVTGSIKKAPERTERAHTGDNGEVTDSVDSAVDSDAAAEPSRPRRTRARRRTRGGKADAATTNGTAAAATNGTAAGGDTSPDSAPTESGTSGDAPSGDGAAPKRRRRRRRSPASSGQPSSTPESSPASAPAAE